MSVKVALLALAVSSFALTGALAAPSGGTPGPHETTFHGAPGQHVLSNWHPPKGKKVIFSTLGQDNDYNCCSGWSVTNPGSAGFTQWFAFSITPTTDTTVTEIVEAVGNMNGTNSVTIALMADDNGVPGKVLQKKTVKNLDALGNCCDVAVDRVRGGVQIKAGTTYWVAALLPKKSQANTGDSWNYSSENTNSGPAAYYDGSQWNPLAAEYSAFAVYGK